MQLEERLTSPVATMLEGFIGSILRAGIKTGCSMRLNFLFDRIVGKVKDELEVTTPTPFILRTRSGEEIVMGVETKEPEK